MTGFAFHPEALSDLHEIWDHIAQYDIDAADRVIGEIFASLRNFAEAPHAGHLRSDLTSRPLRFVVVREYLIAYAVEDDALWVVAVIHGRRNPRVMAVLLK